MYTCHPVCLAVLSTLHIERRTTSKEVLENIYIALVQTDIKTLFHLVTETHISIGWVISLVRGPKRGSQHFQMFPIIPQHWQDLCGHSALFHHSLLRIKKEGHKLTKLLAAHSHYCVCRAGLTETWVSAVGGEGGTCAKWQPTIFMVFKENPSHLPGMTALTIFLSQAAYILMHRVWENPVCMD